MEDTKDVCEPKTYFALGFSVIEGELVFSEIKQLPDELVPTETALTKNGIAKTILGSGAMGYFCVNRDILSIVRDAVKSGYMLGKFGYVEEAIF